jgi:hypothetical protein
MNEYKVRGTPPHLRRPEQSHNIAVCLSQLQEQALTKQLEASKAWEALMLAHEAYDSPWSAVLHSALASGVRTDKLREALAAPPSTYSRWLSGVSQPANMLRKRLSKEVTAAVGAMRSRIESLLQSHRKPDVAA